MKTGMKEIKYLNENEIEVDGFTYSKKKDEEIIPYKGYQWRILSKDDEGTTVVMENKLPKEDMFKVFNKNLLDSDGDIRFNMKYDNIWWRDSVIRMGLNNKFLEMLDIDDLVEMKTTVEYNDEKITTRDYVRIPTKEEYESMNQEVRGMKEPNGSVFKWSLSPYYCNSGAYVFIVDSYGNLDHTSVNNGGAVAPVIKLKNSALEKIEQ